MAWAIPVNPALIGAHLQAHVQIKPVVNTLRLCRTYGRGPRVFITRLPVELLDAVIDPLVSQLRQTAICTWQEDLVCWEGRCQDVDHIALGAVENGSQELVRIQGVHEGRQAAWHARFSSSNGPIASYSEVWPSVPSQ